MDLTDSRFETERLKVRSVLPADAPELARLMTIGISAWVAAWPHPLSPEAALELVKGARRDAAAGRVLPGVVTTRSDGAVIGWVKIELTAQNDAELGYWIGEAHQRRGYARELATGAVRFAFEDMGADAVTAGAQLENDASHSLLAQLGMSPDGERDVWAAGRDRWERCRFWRLQRPDPSETS